MQREIEVKVLNINPDEIEEKLINLGAEKIRPLYLRMENLKMAI